MSDIISPNKTIHFSIGDDENLKHIYSMAHALASYERLEILRLLVDKSMNIYEITKQLKLPKSTVSNHIAVLEDAQILFVSTQQGAKRHVKMCNKQLNELTINFCSRPKKPFEEAYVHEIPIGLFSEANIHAPCGMYIVNPLDEKHDGALPNDVPSLFFDPNRIYAELLWFDYGYVSYNAPNKLHKQNVSKLELTVECCSEIVYHKNDWPSDITVSINDMEVLTFQSPGDFGGRRGRFSPLEWGIESTQYGQLYKITVSESGIYLNDVMFSKKTIHDFSIPELPFVKITFCVKEDAVHRGGINLFGKKFGDYEQAIVLTLYP